MKSPHKFFNPLLMAACLVLFMLSNAIGTDRLVYMGSAVILKTFFIDASKVFKEKTGTRIISNSALQNQGLAGLLDGKCDIAGGGRSLKADERAKGLFEIPFAFNIIAVFVNKNNPVENLSSQQLKDIFAGKITNWKEVGGVDKPILLVTDPPQTMHRKTFTRVIMAGTPLADKILTVKKPPETVEKVSRFQYAISYTSLGLIAKKPNVKAIAIDSKQPVVENAVNKSYGLFMNMYFYTMGKPEGKLKDLVDFLGSEQGRQIISVGGMYPLAPIDY